jgi:hypothetical protein
MATTVSSKEGGVHPHNIAVLHSKDQYLIWSSRVKSYLDELELLVHLEDESQELLAAGKDPLTSTDLTEATKKSWKRNDRKTINKLIPLVSDDLLSLLQGQESAYKGWIKLQEHMDGKEGDHYLRRLQEITNARFDPTGATTLRSHLHRLKRANRSS